MYKRQVQQDLRESLNASAEDISADVLKYYDLGAGSIIDGIGTVSYTHLCWECM